MKEIKCRVWGNGQWLDFNEICFKDGVAYGIDGKDGYWSILEVEIMFDTSLKDKNGKSIYIGDILQARPRNSNYSKPFVMKWEENSPEPFPIPYYASPEDYEIIGNIKENPKLLTN